jgi:hypothetical protein
VRVHEAHPEPADLTRLDPPGVFDGLLERAEHPTRVLEQCAAGGAQPHAAWQPLAEPDPQLVLQSLNLPAQRGLGDAQSPRRPAEMFFLGGDHKVAKLAELHACLIPSVHTRMLAEAGSGGRPP